MSCARSLARCLRFTLLGANGTAEPLPKLSTSWAMLGQRDFDLNGAAFTQRDDSRMGNGQVRPATTYTTYDGSARIGADIS